MYSFSHVYCNKARKRKYWLVLFYIYSHESLTEYLYTLFCCPFLWNFLFDFVFIILIVTLSILVLAIFIAQTEISTDKSGFWTPTTVVRATGLGALASDKLYNCLWSWWKICHYWYPLSIFILLSIAFWWGQHRVRYMIVVPSKKLVVRSHYGLMESSLCGRQPLRLSLSFLKEGPSEGFDSFDVCLWLVHPRNQLFHSTSCAVIWLFPTTEVTKGLQDRSAGVMKLIPTSECYS